MFTALIDRYWPALALAGGAVLCAAAHHVLGAPPATLALLSAGGIFCFMLSSHNHQHPHFKTDYILSGEAAAVGLCALLTGIFFQGSPAVFIAASILSLAGLEQFLERVVRPKKKEFLYLSFIVNAALGALMLFLYPRSDVVAKSIFLSALGGFLTGLPNGTALIAASSALLALCLALFYLLRPETRLFFMGQGFFGYAGISRRAFGALLALFRLAVTASTLFLAGFLAGGAYHAMRYRSDDATRLSAHLFAVHAAGLLCLQAGPAATAAMLMLASYTGFLIAKKEGTAHA